ncbi:ADP-ribosylglycohydrolase family protein [Natrialbaceae archaeon A-CW3]
MVQQDRAAGVLLGLACGDALGRPVEGWSATRIEREYGTLETFVGGGVHDKPPGTVTDDTQLAMVLARSLRYRGTFNRDDFVERLLDWYESQPFGIGGTTTEALRRISAGVPPTKAAERARTTKPAGEKATNGSVMRCAPLAVAYGDSREELQKVSRASSKVTHADPRCVHGCAALNLTIAGFLTENVDPLESALVDLSEEAPVELLNGLGPIPDRVDSDELRPVNDAVKTLRAAFYQALEADYLEEAIVRAVNEGGDADTIGAVTGAVAGARFGASELPERWLSSLEHRTELEQLARELCEFDPV